MKEKEQSDADNIKYVYVKEKRNKAGIAGFIISLASNVLPCINPVGLEIGLILWLVGIVFSIIGLFKKPRALAIAAVILCIIAPFVFTLAHSYYESQIRHSFFF